MRPVSGGAGVVLVPRRTSSRSLSSNQLSGQGMRGRARGVGVVLLAAAIAAGPAGAATVRRPGPAEARALTPPPFANAARPGSDGPGRPSAGHSAPVPLSLGHAGIPAIPRAQVPRPHAPARLPVTRLPRSVPSRTPARVAPSPRGASPASRLSDIQQQLTMRRRLLAQTRQQERRVLGQLSWAQEKLQRAEDRLRQTAVALDGTRREVAQASQSLAAVSRQLSRHEALMGERLRAFYEKGPLAYLDVLLGATGFQDFATRTYLIALIVNRDLELYRQVSAERQQRLAEQQERLRASQEEAARLAAERRRLLEHVRAERSAQETAIRELELESARITDLIRRTTAARRGGPPLTLRNGAFLWPVSGPITSGYGWRIHPIFHTREFHTGIDIAAPWGTPIQAAADGTVLFAGWMRGYGMLVILDHGNGLSTTYSHLSSYSVHVGEHVQRGEVIARIGSTGWSTGPHLFFEIRENGDPIDPLGP